jgi:hypothetical protein
MGDAVIRRNHVSERLPALPGSAPDREIYPPLVRRHAVGLDHLHVVLPGFASGRLWLCARARQQVGAAPAGALSYRHVVRDCPFGPRAFDPSFPGMEAGGRAVSDTENPGAAGGQYRRALSPARLHLPAVAGLVQPCTPGNFTLSALCAFQPRLPAGHSRLSVSDRARHQPEPAGGDVVVGLRGFRRDVRAAVHEDHEGMHV